MKKKLFKQASAGLLAMALIAGILPTGLRPLTVHAANGVKTMNLDTSYLAPSDSTWDANDHKVWFGQYGGTPTAFRVLKAEGTTMMLDCDTILLTKAFDEDSSANTEQNSGNMNEWKGSDLEKWLNGTDYYGNASVFTSGEQSVIQQTSLWESEADYRINSWPFKDYAANDSVYLLSAKEANVLYAYNEARKKTGGYAAWWLRTASANYSSGAGLVYDNGGITTYAVNNNNIGVSPALNLNLASVIFASANGVSKSSDTLTAVTDGSGTKEWKLTLLDSGKSVAVTSGSYVTQSGDTITVPYIYTGSDVSQISVMITSGAYDESGSEILYYGKLNTTLAASGTGSFTLPNGLPAGYKMYILAEDVNGEKYSDYASAPVEITVAEPVEAPTADLTENTYTSNQSVALASATAGADIYYTMTTDGSVPADPTTSSTKYTGAISLAGTEGSSITYKIKAVAVKSGMRDSSVSSFTYTISIPETTYEVIVTNGTGGGSYAAGSDVTITADAAPQGKQFKEWTGADGLTFTDGTSKTSTTAKFTMPANAVSVTATYEDIPVVDDTDDESNEDADDKQPDNQTPDDNGKDDVPKTGDNTPIAWLFALMLISGTGLCITHKKKAVRK